ncbi:MAG: type II toxin-antitoxin system PrlF family antitoxin [Halieaceae bacterium]|jgi:antitoxin PrlF|nr:type II toxin-antitoxin system PrlF family antitoxin [Halieaceae bacterium]
MPDTSPPTIREQATLTSKGQITLPKAIRQALGVESSDKLIFELRGDEVIVARAEGDHEDPAIAGYLNMLERDILEGRLVASPGETIVRELQEQLDVDIDLDEPIEGDVVI